LILRSPVGAKKDPDLRRRRRGGLTSPVDRRKALAILDVGMAAGARSCELATLLVVGLGTLQRWRRQFTGDGDGPDGRKGSQRLVSHRLSEEELQRILLTCNQSDFLALPPGRSCRPWPIRAFTTPSEKPAATVQSTASIGCSMTTARLTTTGEPFHHKNPARCQGSRPGGRIRFRAGTSPTCPQVCVVCGCTSTWWLPGVNYLGGSRQLRRREPAPTPCSGRGWAARGLAGN
jgi:transposase